MPGNFHLTNMTMMPSPTPLPAKTRLGSLELTVSDLSRSLDFYQQALGLEVLDREGQQARLGAGEQTLLTLVEVPGAQPKARTTGLYHFALLVPSRAALARTLQNLIEAQTPVQGFADHLVSEAIYLPDPDYNGIEIYRDRPRDEWTYEDGKLKMATDPLDIDGILAELNGNGAWKGMEAGTTLGHMHLHIADLNRAVSFYKDVVGMDLMATMAGSAGFMAAGGYHHHMGLNTWAGVGAPPPPPEMVGLRYFSVLLPDEDALAALKERLEGSQTGFEIREEGLMVSDPSQNKVLFSA